MNTFQSPDDLTSFVSNGGTIIGVDVDTQRDFVEESGSLYVPPQGATRENIAQLYTRIQSLIGSVDSHAYDSWEFVENDGPFPAHCVKGTQGWLKIDETQGRNTRFVPMSHGGVVIGENQAGSGNRDLSSSEFADEVLDGGVVGIFEKEVYSLFANPNAEPFVRELVERAGGTRNALFAVFGYCTGRHDAGGFCVDSAAEGLKNLGLQTAIVFDATAAIGGDDGVEASRQSAERNDIHILSTQQVLSAL